MLLINKCNFIMYFFTIKYKRKYTLKFLSLLIFESFGIIMAFRLKPVLCFDLMKIKFNISINDMCKVETTLTALKNMFCSSLMK